MRVLLAVGLLLVCSRSVIAEEPAHRRLAEHYAPVVFQETRSTVLDFITRFDYDGDWNGDNNWRNAYLFDLPGSVYYSVIESTNHYFITYAFYHPRDYSARPYEGFAPKTEHENDMEGCTVTIEKDGSPFGKVVLLETLAHDVFYKYNNRSARRVSNGALRLDGSISFVDDRPALYIEAEGHGVKAAGPNLIQAGADFPGVVYKYSGKASVPFSNRDPLATYDLISIEDTLWAHRFDVGTTFCCADPFVMTGGGSVNLGSAFNGPIGSCSAKPPWGWDQASDAIAKGDWFRDPLKSYGTQVRIENFTGTYSHNPYLQSESRTAAPRCSESAASKTVKGAVAASLLGIGQALTIGGFSGEQIGGQAKQLFLSNAVLLEWARKSDFERWTWDQTVAALPALMSEGLRDEMRIPRAAGFSFVSPEFKAPARYFDSLILKYRTSIDGLRARVSWTYEGMTEFSEEMSVSVPLARTDTATIAQIRLTDSPQWDKTKTVSQIRVALERATGTVATVSPGDTSSSEQLVINYIVFDRNAFSDTFER